MEIRKSIPPDEEEVCRGFRLEGGVVEKRLAARDGGGDDAGGVRRRCHHRVAW
jgi:hypothetical protein